MLCGSRANHAHRVVSAFGIPPDTHFDYPLESHPTLCDVMRVLCVMRESVCADYGRCSVLGEIAHPFGELGG